MNRGELMWVLDKSIEANKTMNKLLVLHKPAEDTKNGYVYCSECSLPYEYPCRTVKIISEYYE